MVEKDLHLCNPCKFSSVRICSSQKSRDFCYMCLLRNIVGCSKSCSNSRRNPQKNSLQKLSKTLVWSASSNSGLMQDQISKFQWIKTILTLLELVFESQDLPRLHPRRFDRSHRLERAGLLTLPSVQRNYQGLMLFVSLMFSRGFCHHACLSTVKFSSISSTGQKLHSTIGQSRKFQNWPPEADNCFQSLRSHVPAFSQAHCSNCWFDLKRIDEFQIRYRCSVPKCLKDTIFHMQSKTVVHSPELASSFSSTNLPIDANNNGRE